MNLESRIGSASGMGPVHPVSGAPVGGAAPTARAAQPRTRDATDDGRRDQRSGQQRRDAERELARLLRLAPDEDLEIAVDRDLATVRFCVRDRASGALRRELPFAVVAPLLQQLPAAGVFVDRSL